MHYMPTLILFVSSVMAGASLMQSFAPFQELFRAQHNNIAQHCTDICDGAINLLTTCGDGLRCLCSTSLAVNMTDCFNCSLGYYSSKKQYLESSLNQFIQRCKPGYNVRDVTLTSESSSKGGLPTLQAVSTTGTAETDPDVPSTSESNSKGGPPTSHWQAVSTTTVTTDDADATPTGSNVVGINNGGGGNAEPATTRTLANNVVESTNRGAGNKDPTTRTVPTYSTDITATPMAASTPALTYYAIATTNGGGGNGDSYRDGPTTASTVTQIFTNSIIVTANSDGGNTGGASYIAVTVGDGNGSLGGPISVSTMTQAFTNTIIVTENGDEGNTGGASYVTLTIGGSNIVGPSIVSTVIPTGTNNIIGINNGGGSNMSGARKSKSCISGPLAVGGVLVAGFLYLPV
ncbi:hypothetical protein FRC02_003277 [Tulasnella sp. 418]|nr:hypothetical protein FRC02_003277 [Tulasnella sp. 418]